MTRVTAVVIFFLGCTPAPPPRTADEVDIPLPLASSSATPIATSNAPDGEPTPKKPHDVARAPNDACAISGTRWHIEQEIPSGSPSFDIDFLPGGEVRSHDPADTTEGNDEWELQGSELHFWFNKRYVEFVAPCSANGGEMSGFALNVVNQRWPFVLTRDAGY